MKLAQRYLEFSEADTPDDGRLDQLKQRKQIITDQIDQIRSKGDLDDADNAKIADLRKNLGVAGDAVKAQLDKMKKLK